MSPSDFANALKIKKALGSFKVDLDMGDRVKMNNCDYIVKSPRGAKQTILEDEKGSRIAIPCDKMMLLIKTNMARHYGVDIFKAKPGGVINDKPKGEPVGTMKQDSSGEWRKKISSNPSVWVHMGKGTSHPEAEGNDQHHPLLHDESRKNSLKVYSKILRHADTGDHEKLKNKFMEYVTELSSFKNLMTAHNTAEVDESGKKLPRTSLPKATYDQIYKKQDNAEKHLKQFVDMFRASIEKRKKGS